MEGKRRMRAEEPAGGADPKGGGTTKLDEEFILKVLSQVAEW